MKVRVDSDHRTTHGTGSQIVHELAIMESVVDQVTERLGDAKIISVVLEIGKLTRCRRA
jgi:hypothetical protein